MTGKDRRYLRALAHGMSPVVIVGQRGLSDAVVRQWHHLLMWAFVVFTMIHIYLVFYHDWVEGRGTTSSIIGGWKFEKDEDLRS